MNVRLSMKKFKVNPTAAYREFKGSAIKVTNTLPTEDVNQFWKGNMV